MCTPSELGRALAVGAVALALAPSAGAAAAPRIEVMRSLGAPPVVVWTTGTGVPGAVFVTEDGAEERLFARSNEGRQEAPWLLSDRRYVFRLYSEGGERRLLATATVTPTGSKQRLVAPAGHPPTTSDSVNEVLTFVPYAVLAFLAVLAGWHVRQRTA